jgi:hypothetical protein
VKDDAQKILIGIHEGRCSLERPGRRWEDIKMDIKETGYECVDWIHLAQDTEQWWALVSTVINCRVI